MGVFLALSLQTVDAIQAPFVTGKWLSTFKDGFIFLASVKFLSVLELGVVLQILDGVLPHLIPC